MKWFAFLMGLAIASGCGSRGRDTEEPFPAQSIWVSPSRPRLDAQADTNDPSAYFERGRATLMFRPDTAAAAFYWTTRLDPWRADGYYGRAIALLRTLWGPGMNTNLWEAKRRPSENQLRIVDSLNHIAYELNPYTDRQFDDVVGAPSGLINCERMRDQLSAGICFMHSGNFALSVQKLTAALAKDPKRIELHYLRAQAHYQLGHFDTAATELGVLADSLERRQETKLTPFYVSRATIFYAQGMAYIQRDDTAAARVAYERALVEDLGFHMASVRLAGRALSTGDTTAALSHLAHAVIVSPTDAPLRMYYGIILSARRQSEEARDQFLKAIEINPDYAQPYMHLAQEIESTDLGSAVASYETFLLRSAMSDSSRAWVERRLQKLMQAR